MRLRIDKSPKDDRRRRLVKTETLFRRAEVKTYGFNFLSERVVAVRLYKKHADKVALIEADLLAQLLNEGLNMNWYLRSGYVHTDIVLNRNKPNQERIPVPIARLVVGCRSDQGATFNSDLKLWLSRKNVRAKNWVVHKRKALIDPKELLRESLRGNPTRRLYLKPEDYLVQPKNLQKDQPWLRLR